MKLSELVGAVDVLTRGDGIVSRFDLVKVCGLKEHEIKRLIDSGNLIRIKRGCYEFTPKRGVWWLNLSTPARITIINPPKNYYRLLS